jgi:hypothetical protein
MERVKPAAAYMEKLRENNPGPEVLALAVLQHDSMEYDTKLVRGGGGGRIR